MSGLSGDIAKLAGRGSKAEHAATGTNDARAVVLSAARSNSIVGMYLSHAVIVDMHEAALVLVRRRMLARDTAMVVREAVSCGRSVGEHKSQ